MANQLNTISVTQIGKVFADHGFRADKPLVKVVRFEHELTGQVIYLNREVGAFPDGSIRVIQLHVHPERDLQSVRDLDLALIKNGLRKHADMGDFPMSDNPPQRLSKALTIDVLDYLGDVLGALLGHKSASDPSVPYVEPEWDEPSLIEAPGSFVPKPRSSIESGSVDYVEQARRNKELGDAGEWAALAREKRLLREAGRHDLAERVVHVAREEGDAAGYDIRSFNRDGSARWVEVKTTAGGAGTGFFLTANELSVCRANSDKYVVVRLSEFDLETGRGEVREITGSELLALDMEPLVFKVFG